jgi:dTMP kinase
MKKFEDGLLIILEGGEGVGKTKMAEMLKAFFCNEGYDAIYLREPGSCKLAEDIRNLALYNEIDSTTELFLMSAARSLNFKNNILPALKDNKLIILDRFTASTFIYQGVIGGVKFDDIYLCSTIAAPVEDVNLFQFVLKCDPEVAYNRALEDGHERNKNDIKGIDFYKQISDAYNNNIDYFSNTYAMPTQCIDTTDLTKDEVFNKLKDAIYTIINNHYNVYDLEG